MTISSNRIRYLDKENKVLVQDFSDIGANVPMTDVETPMTIEAMDAIDEGFRILQALQQDLLNIVNALTDGSIANFLIDTLINNLRLNLPGFPGLNAFVQTLRLTDPNALGGLINSLIGEASDYIFTNPSVINRKDGNVQQQVVNIALTNFAQKLQRNEIDQAYITRLSNSGTSDPYAIKSAVTKLNNDYKYATNEQVKFKLPTDVRVANTLICQLSLSLAYYNYYYSTIKLLTVGNQASDFVMSIETSTTVHKSLLDALSLELSKTSLDHESLFYYAEQYSRTISRLVFDMTTHLNLTTQTELLKKYLAQQQTLTGIVSSFMKQKLTTSVSEPYQSPQTAVYINNLMARIKSGAVVLDETLDPVTYQETRDEMLEEYARFLRHSLLLYLQSAKQPKDLHRVYTLINARNSITKQTLAKVGELTATQTTTLLYLLTEFWSIDLYTLEGDQTLERYNIRLTSPMSSYIKITQERFYTSCLDYLRLLYNQFYTYYPTDGTSGLLSNIVDRITKVRIDLVINNPTVRNVVVNPAKTFADLVLVLHGTPLHNSFVPEQYNSNDADIYNLYKRELRQFVFNNEDVTVIP